MPPGDDDESEAGPERRQVLAALAVGGLTALSATVIATGSLIGARRARDDEEPDDQDQPEDGTTAEGAEDDADEEGPSLSVDWTETHGSERPDAFFDLHRSGDGAVLVGVTSDDELAGEGWLVGADAEGQLREERTYASERNREKRAVDEGGEVYDAVETVVPVDDGWLLVGWTHDLSPDSKHPWLVRVDADGQVLWERSYARPGVNSFRDVFLDAVRVDGGFLLGGVTLGDEFVDTRRGDGWLALIDDGGDVVWEDAYTPEGEGETSWTDDDRHDRFTTILPRGDGFLLAGTATTEDTSDVVPSDGWLVSVDADGQREWSTTLRDDGWIAAGVDDSDDGDEDDANDRDEDDGDGTDGDGTDGDGDDGESTDGEDGDESGGAEEDDAEGGEPDETDGDSNDADGRSGATDGDATGEDGENGSTGDSGESNESDTDDTDDESETASGNVVIEDALQTDRGVLLAGTVGKYEYVREFRSNALRGDGWVGAVDEEGDLAWAETIPDANVRAIERVDADTYVLAGRRDEQPWVGVVDPDGQLLDEALVAESSGELAAVTAADELLVAGWRYDDDTPSGFVAALEYA